MSIQFSRNNARNSPLGFTWVTGRYYPACFWHGGFASTAGVINLNTITISLFFVPNRVTVSSVSAEMSSGTTNTTWRFGLYYANRFILPGKLLVDWGTVSTGGVAGVKTIGGLSTPLDIGWYWAAMYSAAGVAIRTSQSLILAHQGPGIVLGGSHSAIFSAMNFAIDGLPSSLPVQATMESSSSVYTGNQVPRILLGV